MPISIMTVFSALAVLWNGPALAAPTGGAPTLDGGVLGVLWALPFIAIILSIAIFPLVAPRFWHHHFGKVSAACTVGAIAPMALVYGVDVALYEFLHTVLIEYVPFIVLLLALYTIAGGIRITGALVGTPATNTGILAFGTIIASWVGTTGACMLLIHPLVRANQWRQRNVHVFIFFIFLVGNIGGALTPLGDPPLFIGFLQGIDFFWTARWMFVPMVALALPLLALFYALDSWVFRKEGPPPAELTAPTERLGVEGKRNILLLGGVVGAVLMSGVWKSGIEVTIYYVPLELESIVRTLVLIALVWLSWQLTSSESRQLNGFSWFPIVEVAKLFIGIFVTMVPVIAIIRAGEAGAARDLVGLLNAGGRPDNVMYFWITGVLSSFLDNAPTYLVFFNFAGGNAQQLMGPLAGTLLAISAGAVFMGANTYIGNAPNFMVKSVVESRGIKMPSFFGYMVWSTVILVPLFALMTFVFFR
ncbi:MAG: sodium:proton antiporter [Rhodospirillales bacterium]|nr:sodium:proton antiporter [Rhodospirillales bacterium]